MSDGPVSGFDMENFGLPEQARFAAHTASLDDRTLDVAAFAFSAMLGVGFEINPKIKDGTRAALGIILAEKTHRLTREALAKAGAEPTGNAP